MIDIESVLNNIISTLNTGMNDFIFIRNYNIKNRPPYPYGTIGVTTAYIPEGENHHLRKTQQVVGQTLEITRHEQPQMVLSFSVFSDDELQAQVKAMESVSNLKFVLNSELSVHDIIVLEVTDPNNITGILEENYEFRYQFDVRIRVKSEVTKVADYVEIVAIENENTGQEIIIE